MAVTFPYVGPAGLEVFEIDVPDPGHGRSGGPSAEPPIRPAPLLVHMKPVSMRAPPWPICWMW